MIKSIALISALIAPLLLGTASTALAGEGARDRIRALVVEEAQALGVAPALALAVAHAESHFQPTAESHKGARGVMQVMPATVEGEYALHADILWQPRYNIRIGLHFLRSLLARYHGRVAFALSYYNGGSRVGSPAAPRIIPATRPYVDKVQRLRQEYRRQIASRGLDQWTQQTRLAASSRPARGQG